MANGTVGGQGMSGTRQGIRIAILVEGATEQMFKNKLNEFLETRLPEDKKRPNLIFTAYDGRIPKNEGLKRIVTNLLESNRGLAKVDHVIALTDVYTGTSDFKTAEDAKQKMRAWVGDEPRFHPHVALHDFEAWLLPFWPTIQKLADSNKSSPGVHPEQVNHNKPPAEHIRDLFRTGTKGKRYIKPRDGSRILRDNDLLVTADACPELKAFLNTILRLCGGELL